MRLSLLSALMILGASCKKSESNQENVFSSVKYDSVTAYNYDGQGGIEIIDKNGQLAETIKSSIQLNKSQIIELTSLLSDKSTYGGDVAACFDPHFGLVFYQQGKTNAYVSICLECNYLVSSIKIPTAESGFSDSGIENITSFQKQIGF